jgi:serine/threonine-protein kinase
MGSVYEVEHTELGKRFVLKALLSDLSRREDLVARLRNEQRALGRLEHPSIINVTDAGVTTSNVPYFVMERLDGETLAARLKRTGYLPIGEALEIAAGVLDGLAAAHEIGVIHRDIKPPNIFLVQGKYPKILDFGVAKVADTTGAITARGTAVGTPRYMSPEQASGEKVDGRSDIYAVGLLLYESVVGEGPFDDVRDANEMLLAHLTRLARRLSTRVGSVTRELDEVLAQLLAKNPADRPSSAREAAARLRAVAAPYAHAPHEAGGHALTVRLNLGVPAPTTRADGVAARHAWSAREGTTEDAKTVARLGRQHGPNDTLVDARRSGSFSPAPAEASTFRDYSHTAPPTRTEILPVAEAPFPGDVETHTRVPITPIDGSQTLDPVPLSSLTKVRSKTQRSTRAVAVAVAVAGILVTLLGIGGVLSRGGVTSSSASVAPARASAPKEHVEPHGDTAPASAVMGVAPAKAVSDPSAPVPSPRVVTSTAAASSTAPPEATPKKNKKSAKQKVVSPRVPDGLPSSGL